MHALVIWRNMNIFKQDLSKRREMILKGNIYKSILFLAFPTIVMGIVQTFIPASDGLFVNRLLGPLVGGAIIYSQPPINIILAISQGLGLVSMTMIGQLNGRDDKEGIKSVALQVIMYGLFLGLLFVPITILVAYMVANSLQGEISKLVFTYIAFYSLAMPFNFMAAIFNAIKNATGNPEAPLIRMLVLLVLKVLFNYIFLYVFGMGIIGTVLATLGSYIFTSIWMYYDLFIKESEYKLDWHNYHFQFGLIKEMTILSLPLMLSSALVNLGFFLINKEISVYGHIVLDGMGIASQINNIYFVLPSNIATAMTTIISMHIGNNNIIKAKTAYKAGTILSVLISTVMSVSVLFVSDDITGLFTDDAGVLHVAKVSLIMYTYSVIPFAVFTTSQAVFNGLGKNIVPLIMGIFRIWIFRYLFILITKDALGYYSIIYGNLFSNALAAIIFVFMALKLDWKSNIKI